MPMIDYIDVRILANNQPLQEYPEPNGDTDGDRSRVRYVESVVGQRFAVLVRLLPNFELKHAPCFFASFHIDGNAPQHYNHALHDELDHRHGYLQNTKTLTVQDSVPVWDDATGRWALCAFEFGALGISKSKTLGVLCQKRYQLNAR
jgi:hypothetical protein